jgi:hypothetical protein
MRKKKQEQPTEPVVETKDEEFIEVVGDADEVINEVEEDVE